VTLLQSELPVSSFRFPVASVSWGRGGAAVLELTTGGNSQLAHRQTELATGNLTKLATVNWQLATGNWQLATGNW